MRIGIDYTAAVRQRAGIGRYTRELITALLALESAHQYVLFAAAGGIQHPASSIQYPASNVQFRTLPISDEWLARLWHRLRLPIPVETITGPLDVFYSPDFVLPPIRRSTCTLLTVHDLSFMRYPDAFVPKLRRYLERVVPRSIARADLVLADSAATQADIISLLGVPPGKVQVLYGGVHPRFRPQPEPDEAERIRARYGLDERPYVLSVGTIQPRKNYARLIHAFNQLTNQPTNQPTN
nr:glycosyltransferase family 1 protein [Anaerolineae bacterium]